MGRRWSWCWPTRWRGLARLPSLCGWPRAAWRSAASPSLAALHGALAVHHRPDSQYLPAGSAQPHASDSAAGRLRLPAPGRETAAGVLVATAAAIKAFPILAVGYFVYRRMWRATLASVAALAIWLLVVPLPFRTPAQALSDLSIWSRGMVFTYNTHGIAQRPYRSYSYKNQSIMALAHRFLRDVPADGEKVLSQHIAEQLKGQPVRGMLADGSIDLAALLTAPAEGPRWDSQLEDAGPALRRAWRVNFASLNFPYRHGHHPGRHAWTFAPGRSGLSPRQARTPRTDAIEFALITLLIVMFSPLSFNYAYVWLIYPLTVALHEVRSDPARGALAKGRARLDHRRFLHPQPGRGHAPVRPGLWQPLRPGAPHGDWPGSEAAGDRTTAGNPEESQHVAIARHHLASQASPRVH